MIKVKIPMKKIALIAALFLFAGVITVLFACTPEAHTNFDADKKFSRLLEEVRYSAELEDASEYSDYILSDLPEGTDVKMYICGGSHADAVIMCKAGSSSDLPEIRSALDEYIAAGRRSAERYDPNEVSKYDKAVRFESGLYVFVCITADVSSAAAILK